MIGAGRAGIGRALGRPPPGEAKCTIFDGNRTISYFINVVILIRDLGRKRSARQRQDLLRFLPVKAETSRNGGIIS